MIRKIKQLLKKIVVAAQGPYKQIRVGNFSLTANRESRLDEFLERHPNYSRNFSKLVSKILANDPKSHIIDIGANIGDTVALLRSENIDNPIICIEGNCTYLELLHKNSALFENIVIFETFLSDKESETNAKVITEEGTATIVSESTGAKIKMTSLDTLLMTKKINDIKILKVDTDGYDILILNGSKSVISENLPVIFFEYDNKCNAAPQSCLDWLLSLKNLGYHQSLFYDNLGNFLMAPNLLQDELITQLDAYIAENGAFSYYDVAVFHKNDQQLADSIIKSLVSG